MMVVVVMMIAGGERAVSKGVSVWVVCLVL